MNIVKLIIFGIGVALCATVFAEGADVATVNNAQYNKECGACHFAYPPGLLPARSWERLFSSLNKHFGENAELDDSVTQTLKTYATQNAADKSNYSRSVKIMRALRDGETPMRITELAYIRAKHHEIPTRMVAGNPKVGSLSKCEACHQHAAAGSFSEHDVKIPGFGRWE